MKKLFIVFITLICFFIFSSNLFASNEMFPVRDANGKWGYINSTGKVVIKIIFDDAKGFSEGLAAVKKGNLWAYIDTTGKKIIDFAFIDASSFSEGLAAVREKDIYTGYIDRTGKYVIEPKYAYAQACAFSGGLAAVWEYPGFKWGYINKTGSYVIAPQFKMTAARPFKEERAAVQIDNKWGYIDPKGSIIIEPQFFVALDFSEGMAMVQEVRVRKSYSYGESGSTTASGGNCGYINKMVQYVIKPSFSFALGFFEGLAAVEIGDERGYINKNGEIVISPRFDGGRGFSEGLAVVYIIDKKTYEMYFGYIDKSGNYIIKPANYFNAFDFSGGLALVITQSNQRIYIDKEGKVVWKPKKE